jgi:hypothetical protein
MRSLKVAVPMDAIGQRTDGRFIVARRPLRSAGVKTEGEYGVFGS